MSVKLEWTHAICDNCWDEQNPDRPSPRTHEGSHETCCFCSQGTISGIYVRADPKETACKGVHDDKDSCG